MGLIYSTIPELEGTDTFVTLSNLLALEKELGETIEKRISHLCELADAIIKDGGDPDLVKSIILSIRSDGGIDSLSYLDSNEKELRAIFSDISIIERLIIFERVFSGRLSEHPLNSSQYVSDASRGRIAYVKNSYNDTAFGQFASFYDGARAAYYNTPVEVCESVVSGECQFCILPLETGKDGKLFSFYKLINDYGLRINCECDLKGSDGDSFTRYALLGKELNFTAQVRRTKGTRIFLEISYSDTENMSMRDLLSVADYLGFEMYSVDTLLESDSGKRFNLVFIDRGADLRTFLTYMSVDCPDHAVIGYYQIV